MQRTPHLTHSHERRHRSRRGAAGILATALMFGALAAPVAGAAEPTPHGPLAPVPPPAFQPDEPVEFRVTMPAGNTVRFGSVPADGDGVYLSPFYDTSGLAPYGTYTITLVGATSGYVSDTFEVIVDPNPPVIDPKVTVTPETSDQLQVFTTGWELHGTGFIPGDYVRHWLITPTGSTIVFAGFTVNAGGGFDATNVTLGNPIITPGPYVMHFQGRLQGQPEAVTTVQVTKATPPADNTLQVSVDPSAISPADLHTKGVTVLGAGGRPNDRVALVLTYPTGAMANVKTGAVAADGTFSAILRTSSSSPDLGNYQVDLYAASGDIGTATFVVDPDAGTPDADLGLTLSTSRLSGFTLGTDGLSVDVTGLAPGEVADLTLIRPNGRRVIVDTQKAADDGTISQSLTYLTKDAPAGTYQLRVDGTSSGFQRTTFEIATTPKVTFRADADTYLRKNKVHLVVQGVNTSKVPVTVDIETAWGAKTFASVRPGKFFTWDLNTKVKGIPAGSVKVRATAIGDVQAPELIKTLRYAAVGKGHRTYEVPSIDRFKREASRLPAGLVSAVKRDLGMSGAQYLAQAEAGYLAEQVIADLGPNSVEDAWIDADRTLHVVAADSSTARAAAELGVVATTRDPLGDKAAAANAAQDGRHYYVDRAAGQVRSYDQKSLQTTDVRANELEGGDGFLFGSNGASYRCSLAFAGVGAFGQPVHLTAGHCVEGSDRAVGAHLLDLDSPTAFGGVINASAIVGQFGWTGSGEIGNTNDGGLLNVQAPYRSFARVSTWGGGQGSQDDGPDVQVYDSVEAIAGMPVCKSGSTSGWTCGNVVDPETTETIGDGKGGVAGTVTAFIFDACILSGDSGGAILSGNYALGVDSFGNMQTCDNAKMPGFVSGGFAIRSGSSSVATQFGEDFNLSISVSTPTLDLADRVSSVASLSGTVQAAAGASVMVTVDGTKYVTTATAGGRWALDLPQALNRGRHTITLMASHRAVGSLVETTSDVTKRTIQVG